MQAPDISRARDEGFTLIELMTVVLIIAILLGIAIAAYVPASRSAAAAACRYNQGVLEKAATEAEPVLGADLQDLEDLRPFLRNFDKVSVCPDTGEQLVLDPNTLTVTCPEHP